MTRVHAYRRNSHEIALVMMGSDGAGQPTERWQDKSREVRGGRSGPCHDVRIPATACLVA